MHRKIFVVVALLGLFSMFVGTLEVLSRSLTVPEPPDRVQVSVTDYDTLVHVASGDPDTLDPAWNYESIGNHIIQQVYEPLLMLKREKTTEFVPMLASDWTISPDGLTYTFDIRQGVKFHNGNDLTPEDVAYTFQRGLLQGGTWSPQWLLAEALLGNDVYDVCQLLNQSVCDDREALQSLWVASPTLVSQVCVSVTQAIVADEAQGAVTFNLAQPWSPFLNTLAQSYGSIIDKDWTIQNGGWDGDCATWQNYYGVTSEDTPLRAIANGTGPFMLDQWTKGEEIVLARNPQYWRKTPIWVDGPSGPVRLGQVIHKSVPTATTRVDMLLNGDADLADVSSAEWEKLDEQVLLSYEHPAGLGATLQSPTGTLRAYRGLADAATDAFFVYDIATGGERNYIGSGVLDGNGIPTDFFTDTHIRKAFNYAFNWDRYITEVYDGEAIQHRGPIIKGILGYTDTQATYTYSPTMALQEFSQAWDGQVITTGFSLTLTYNQGNVARQHVAEILKADLEALSPQFHVNVVALEWANYLDDVRNSRMPLFVSGWRQDYPHPHSWVAPWLVGTYAARQKLPDSQMAIYQAKINTCLQKLGKEAQTCYADIQNTTYMNATDIFLAQAKTWHYTRAEVQGYYVNMALGPYYYALSKGPIPVVKTVAPDTEQSVNFNSALGATATIGLPAGSFNQALDIVITADTSVYLEPTGYSLGDFTFEVQAFNSAGGTLVLEPRLNNPVTLTLHYDAHSAGALVEDTMQLFWWNGKAWEDAACGDYVRDTVNNTIQVPICHFSKFALGGEARYDVYLPLVLRILGD